MLLLASLGTFFSKLGYVSSSSVGRVIVLLKTEDASAAGSAMDLIVFGTIVCGSDF